MTLLERVKQTEGGRKRVHLLEDFDEVAMAWVRDEVSLLQITKGLDISPMVAYQRLANSLKEYINSKK